MVACFIRSGQIGCDRACCATFTLCFKVIMASAKTHSVSFVSLVQPNTQFCLSAGVNIRSLRVCYRGGLGSLCFTCMRWRGNAPSNVMESRLGLHNPTMVPASKKQWANNHFLELPLGSNNRKLTTLFFILSFLQ